MSECNRFMAMRGWFVSFISRCVLPLFPVFLSYITSMSVSEIKDENKKINRKSLLHTIFFLIGFSSIFIMIGFSTTFVSKFLLTYQDIIRQIGAILIIFFGLVIVGIFNFQFLMIDKKITFKNRPSCIIGFFLIGVAFSLAAYISEYGRVLLISYMYEFSVPFLVLSFLVGRLSWIRRHSQKLVKLGGYVIILMGIALFFDWMTKLTSLLANWVGFQGF